MSERSAAIQNNSLIRRITVSIIVGSISILAVARCTDGPDDLRLSPDEVATACKESGITKRPGTGSAIVVRDPESPKSHFSGFPENITKQSIKASGKNVVLTEAASVPAAAGQSLGQTALEYGYTPQAIECLNGVSSDYIPKSVSTITIPRSVYDPSSGSAVVVKSGDTLTGIAKEQCRQNEIKDTVKGIINRTGLDPKDMLPGDIVYISCKPDGSAEFTEPNLEIKNYVDTFGQYAQAVEDNYGVPKDLVLAISALESGYGKSELAMNANNFHGLKANDEWDGPTYQKITTEHVTKEQFSQFPEMIGEPQDIGGGYYSIKVPAYFKKFVSPADGFNGFGEHLKNRFGGDAYKDAFAHRDAIDFLGAMLDDEGAKYATDIEYEELVGAKIEQIRVLIAPTPEQSISTEIQNFESDYHKPNWDDLSDTEKSQFLNSEDEFNTSIERALAARPTPDGYNAFTNSISDISDEVLTTEYFGKLFPSNRKLTVDKPRIVLHYTDWPIGAWHYDGRTYLRSAYNHCVNTGSCGAAGMYLNKDGKKLEVFIKPDQAAYHAGTRQSQKYNDEARGVETPADKQSDITTEQYEGIIYTVVWQYLTDHAGEEFKIPSYQDMKVYVIGHGEMTDLAGIGSTHSDFPTVIADAVALGAHRLISQIGN
jgi:LysM repeat protein